MSHPVVVSVSRRSDIPAFFPDRFGECLDRGFAEFPLPYSGTPARVALSRDRVAAFVFWTRNPVPFLPVLRRLEREGYPFVFQFTITGHPRSLEPGAPAERDAVRAFRELSRRIGPDRVLWRFDPILPGEDPEGLVRRFDRLSAALEGSSFRCTASLAHPYRKSLRATRSLPGLFTARGGLRESVERIAERGARRGFGMLSCCSPLLASWGIPAGACVDGELLRRLFPGSPVPAEPSPTRPGCRCSASRDIGRYRTCRHGCLYCYAA